MSKAHPNEKVGVSQQKEEKEEEDI